MMVWGVGGLRDGSAMVAMVAMVFRGFPRVKKFILKKPGKRVATIANPRKPSQGSRWFAMVAMVSRCVGGILRKI
jgi:hypothetical protein